MTSQDFPPIVQMYDYSKVREYYKRYQGFLFSYDQIVRTETIDKALILRMHTDKMPERIELNGKAVKLVEI